VTPLLLAAWLAPAHAAEGPGITFSRLVVRDDAGDFLGTADVGIRVLEHLRDAGLDARGSEDLMFGTDRSGTARFILGGTVEDFEIQSLSVGSEAEITLRWAVHDRVTDGIVYERRDRCYARDVDPAAEVGLEAFDDCLDALAQRAAFRSLLDEPAAVDEDAEELPEPDWSDTIDMAACEEAPERSLPAAMPEVMPAVLVVQAGDATGTGVNISPDGYVLTASHVVEDVEVGADGLEVRTGSGLTLPAKVVRRDPHQDVALLHLPGSGYACVPLGPLPALGADLFAVGNPMGSALEFSLSRGIVSGHRTWAGVRFLQTDASINPGFSGGPLLDGQGRAVGLISWKIQGEGLEGLGFGVPTDAALERLGLAFAETSTEDPVALGGVVEHEAPSELELVKDHDTLPTSRYGVLMEQREVDQRRILGTVGWATAVAGGAMVVGSWAIAQQETMTLADWQATQAFNTVGWLGVLSGTGLGIAGSVKW